MAVSRILHSSVLDQRRESSWNQSSRERSFPGAKGPAISLRGAKGPGSELARVLLADSLLGTNGPWSEKAVNRGGGIPIGGCLPGWPTRLDRGWL